MWFYIKYLCLFTFICTITKLPHFTGCMFPNCFPFELNRKANWVYQTSIVKTILVLLLLLLPPPSICMNPWISYAFFRFVISLEFRTIFFTWIPYDFGFVFFFLFSFRFIEKRSQLFMKAISWMRKVFLTSWHRWKPWIYQTELKKWMLKFWPR